jgi:ketol-acid reductoisomerase
MILAPDEHQAAIWADDIHGNLRPARRSPSPTA